MCASALSVCAFCVCCSVCDACALAVRARASLRSRARRACLSASASARVRVWRARVARDDCACLTLRPAVARSTCLLYTSPSPRD
eukprot:12549735-Alexandrium_andersonii.AAC.1